MAMTPRSSQSLVPFVAGTKKVLNDLFLLLRHPYLLPIEFVDVLTQQRNAVIMWRLVVDGSLRDLIHRDANPIHRATKKYGTSIGRPLPPKKIFLYTRQIVEALLFLRSKQLPHRNLHAGNVIVDRGVCRLVGYESCIFGLKPRLSRLVAKLRPLEDANVKVDSRFDILCLGHIIFEMGLGYELASNRPDVEHLVGKCG